MHQSKKTKLDGKAESKEEREKKYMVEICARESLQKLIISIGVKSTHVEEEKKKNHIEEYHMPGSWTGHLCKCSKKLFRSIAHPDHRIMSREKCEERYTVKKAKERGRNHTRLSSHRSYHLEKTLTTPSPPPLTTQRPSRLQTTAQTPSPRINR